MGEQLHIGIISSNLTDIHYLQRFIEQNLRYTTPSSELNPYGFYGLMTVIDERIRYTRYYFIFVQNEDELHFILHDNIFHNIYILFSPNTRLLNTCYDRVQVLKGDVLIFNT